MGDHLDQQMGNYRLIRLLGQGGFATVYLGEHVHLGTQAAIKVLNLQVESRMSELFRTEARIIARLEHPHIVRVLDFGVERDAPFLVMSYAPGGSLRDRHPKGTILPLANIVPYIKQIASALQYAHDQRVIHRDVKPENMLIGRGEDIFLSDFGIAIAVHSTHSMSLQNEAGTIPYMAPEQIQGKARPASDQYALGVAVYEWLSGTRPFNGSYWEIVTQHLSVPPPPLHEKISSISPGVEEVVLRALSKEPYQRFASVQDFATALEEASQRSEQGLSSSSSSELSLSSTSALPPNISTIDPRTQASPPLSGYLAQPGLEPNQAPPPLLPAFSASPTPPPLDLTSPSDQMPPASQPPTDETNPPSQLSQRNYGVSSRDLSLQSIPTVNLPMQPPLPLPFSQQAPQSFQQLPEYGQSPNVSAKSTQRRIGRSTIFIILLLVLLMGGIGSYVALGLGNTTQNSRKGSITQQPGTPGDPGISTPVSTPTVNPIFLGNPFIDHYSHTEVADDTTFYTFSAHAVDQSIDVGHGKPVHASDITCKLWLTKDGDVNSNMPASRLTAIDTISNPFPQETIDGLIFDPTTLQTQFCNSNGVTTWKYKVASFVDPGTYYLVVLTDWKGVHYNWNWVGITITR